MKKTTKSKAKKSKKHTTSTLLKALSILFIIFVLHLSYLKLGAASAAEEFLKLVFEGKSFQSYEMTHSTFRQSTPFPDFENITQISALGQLGEFNVEDSDLGFTDWRFHNTLNGTLDTRTSGIQFDFEIVLTRTLFDWKILFFRLPPSQSGPSLEQ